MRYSYTKKALLGIVLLGTTISYGQVSIGDQSVPDTRAILDLTNSDNLGLLLPKLGANPNPTFTLDPEGMLFYYGDNLFLKGSGSTFSAITPWKSIYTTATPTNVYFNPTGYTGVGIGLDGSIANTIKANLHVALNGKEVKTLGTSASFLIGDSDAGTHMSFDNDEIMVKTTPNVAGTLKLQEGGGTVQIGESITATSTLNVFGKVKEHGNELVPQGVIVSWFGLSTNVPAGWALCDGQKYQINTTTGLTEVSATGTLTPNLQSKFVIGAGAGYTASSNYGAASTSITLTKANIPKHFHKANGDNATMNIVGSGSHSHTVDINDTDGSGSSNVLEYDNATSDEGDIETHTDGNHTHANSNFQGNVGDGTTDGLAGSAFSVAIIPTCKALYYIMKL